MLQHFSPQQKPCQSSKCKRNFNSNAAHGLCKNGAEGDKLVAALTMQMSPDVVIGSIDEEIINRQLESQTPKSPTKGQSTPEEGVNHAETPQEFAHTIVLELVKQVETVSFRLSVTLTYYRGPTTSIK